MIAPRLELLALATLPDAAELLPWLAAELRERLGFREIGTAALPLRPHWLEDPERATPAASEPLPRLLSNRVVDDLVARADHAGRSHHELWTLAVTAHDLAAPGREYVFGEATLGGGWALLSTARLAPHASHAGTLRDRLRVEALHELGHLAGLPHCSRPRCAMHPSVNPEEVDRKEPRFCHTCLTAATAGSP